MLAGQATLSQTVERIQTRTRQLAKRQVTWFRHLEEVRPINVTPDERAEPAADRLALSIELEQHRLESGVVRRGS
jgi:tRNA dimethylallyltransferase